MKCDWVICVLRLALRLKYLIQFAPSSVSLRMEILQSSLDPVPKYRLSPASRFRVEKNVTENAVGVTSSLSFGDKSLWPFDSYYQELKAYTVWGKDCILISGAKLYIIFTLAITWVGLWPHLTKWQK